MLPVHTMISLLLATLGGIIWLIRLEGKLTVLERRVEWWIAAETDRWEDVRRYLDRIEGKFSSLEHKIDLIRLRCVAFHHGDAPTAQQLEQG